MYYSRKPKRITLTDIKKPVLLFSVIIELFSEWVEVSHLRFLDSCKEAHGWAF